MQSLSASGLKRVRRIAFVVGLALIGLAIWQAGGDSLKNWTARLRYEASVSSQPAPAFVTVPVAGVLKARIADTFGAPRSGGRIHEGVDIFAPRGTPILAASGGMVVQVGTDTLGGRVVTVLGPGGRRYYYAHLEGYAPGLEAGQRVATGDPLGTVGDSGNAAGTPTHLHFGVYENGWKAVNPWPLLEDAPPADE